MTGRPDMQELQELRRQCVECGLCLPTCATWAVTGNEVFSPRGRLLLMEDMLAAGHGPDDPTALASFDQCIGCRACETACPSGVPFSLFEQGKDWAAAKRRTGGLPVSSTRVPGWLMDRLDRPGVLRALKKAAPLARLAPASVAKMASSLPTAPDKDGELTRLLDGLVADTRESGSAPRRDALPPAQKVAFFSGCANAGLMPATSRRLIDLLRRCGCVVTIPEGQGCCGALAAHTGRSGDRDRLREANRQAFGAMTPGSWMVVEAAGCGVELKESLAPQAGEILDATEALDRLQLPAMGPVPLKVAYHSACHREHGQRVSGPPRRILEAIPGLELVEPDDAALCCGSGGVWSLQNPQLAAAIGHSKAEALLATGADLVVTTNPGCLGQIRGALTEMGSPLPILPLTDLLWYACS